MFWNSVCQNLEFYLLNVLAILIELLPKTFKSVQEDVKMGTSIKAE